MRHPSASEQDNTECGPVRAPAQGRQREEQAAPPPENKKRGGRGGGAKTAHSHQTTRQNHQRRPNPPPRRHRRQDPQRGTGGPPSQNRQHQARNSGPPGKVTLKHADTHHEKKKNQQPSPKERGWGDRDHKARDTDTQQPTPQSKKTKSAKKTPGQPSQEGRSTAETRAQHARPHRTPEPETAGGKRPGQPQKALFSAKEREKKAEGARNHTRPISRPKPKPNHEHHKQPAKEGQHHKPCPNTPTQDPSQDWRG